MERGHRGFNFFEYEFLSVGRFRGKEQAFQSNFFKHRDRRPRCQ